MPEEDLIKFFNKSVKFLHDRAFVRKGISLIDEKIENG